MDQNNHYPLVSEHRFVLSLIPVSIMRQKKKCEICVIILDNMERRQTGFNHRSYNELGISDDQYKN